ncbi:hypothetical protein BY996DRAFT_4582397 [Phakopsora pachyrhizi]|nr:hypothetical protein BY996DRAFT_4582397 [Phakopsora pachyrhizi]
MKLLSLFYRNPIDTQDPIPWLQMIKALIECYNFSCIFAILFVFAANLRFRTLKGFNIQHLAKHGLIEHDASISRYDLHEGDNLNPQSERIEEFFNSIPYPKYITKNQKMVNLSDYAKRKIALEKNIISYPPQQSKAHVRFLGIGESVLALQAFEDNDMVLPGRKLKARQEWLGVWYHEERLPVELGWRAKKSCRKMTILHTILNYFRLSKEMKKQEN